MAFPKIVAFDLDYTLWPLWIDCGYQSPFRRVDEAPNKVLDKRSRVVSFYRDVPQILHELKAKEGVQVAACSRTTRSDLAGLVLSIILVPPPDSSSTDSPKPAIDFFDITEIYPGSKLTHFRKIHQETGIEYEDMLFFDDEPRNDEVETLGVTFVLVEDGLNRNVFDEGVKEWHERRR